jgi:hypothetical protein
MEAGGREYRQLVQLRVDVFEEQRSAVASMLRERLAVMLAADARLAVRRRWCITLNDEPGGDLACDGLLEPVCTDVAEAAVPESVAQRGLTAQGSFGRGWCRDIQPHCGVADGSCEAALAVLQEHHLLVLDLNAEAVVRDEVQDGKEIVLQGRDIQDTRQQHGTQQLIRRF